MGRRQSDAERGVCALAIIFLMGISSCIMVYHFLIGAIRPSAVEVSSTSDLVKNGEQEECCRGTDHVELWGGAVKWGSNFKFNSSRECCLACKAMCEDQRGRCLCDSWVFCGDSKICGSRFGEGIVRVETEYGSFRMKLFPDCAPHSVNFILELLALGCVGCQFHRAESRGSFWFSNGEHVENAPYGPPFALIQGTLEAHGIIFEENPKEYCPTIRRGSVAWVDSGPEFFISLANHDEWRKAHTVFGSVLPEDMEIVEKIAQLPTKPEVWQNIDVSVLEKPIPLQLKGMKTDL